MKPIEHKEIEVRFLEINEQQIKEKLAVLGAIDLGEDLLEEIIFYDRVGEWQKLKRKCVRLRKTRDKIILSYKENHADTIDGTEEIEFVVSDMYKAKKFLEKLNLVATRRQQKKRHSFTMDGVTVDIDTWPRIPTYIELEGETEYAIKLLAERLGFDWSTAVFENARIVIEERYGIPIGAMQWFTFDRFE